MKLLRWLVVISFADFVRSEQVDSKSAKKFQIAIMQQNLQTIIMSIEERLRNLDAVYSSRQTGGVEAKLEEFSRKLDNIESKMAHIEAIMHLQLDKLSENMSTRFYKDDINRDHIKRKLDVINENINNRLTYSEIKLDMIGRNAHDNNNLMKSKLQKLEDQITSKLSDVEVGISDSIVSLEEAKDACKFDKNTTNNKISDVMEKTILDYFTILENKYHSGHKEVVDNLRIVEENVKQSINKSYDVIVDVEDNLNEFTNKISEMGDTIYDKNEIIERNIAGLSKVINITRNEMQNNFRSMMVQMGRSEKNNMFRESSQILEEMDKKIENNFENVILAQNIFLQSCHRLQMDESQLENKIGEIFQKLLDTLDTKMLVEASEVKELNKLIKNVVLTKSRPILKNVDIQYLTDIFNNVNLMTDQLSQIEESVNKTLEISQNNMAYQHGLSESFKQILNCEFNTNKTITNNISTANVIINNNTEDINRIIDCVVYRINCTEDILNSKTVNKARVGFDNDNNDNDDMPYDIDVRSLMNANIDSDLSAINNEEETNINTSNEDDSSQQNMNDFLKLFQDTSQEVF